MSLKKFQAHMLHLTEAKSVSNGASEDQTEIDFSLSLDERTQAEVRALQQAQAEIEMSQTLISDILSYSMSHNMMGSMQGAGMAQFGQTSYKFGGIQEEKDEDFQNEINKSSGGGSEDEPSPAKFVESK